MINKTIITDITDITDITNISDISNITDIKKNNSLIISFDNNTEKLIKDFFSTIKFQPIIDLYTNGKKKFSFELDLLELKIENNLNIYLWFVECIDKANKIITSKTNPYKKLFSTNIDVWNVSIFESNLMFNYPFTLGDVIFFPLDYIISEFNISNTTNTIKIINTLVHEKIHIAQRYNEEIWEQYIKNNGGMWLKIVPGMEEFKIIDKYIADSNKKINSNNLNFISNPDTSYEHFKYVWIESTNPTKKYFGHFMHNNLLNKIEKKYFFIDYDKSTLKLINNFELEQEHPYEIYAYKIANLLVK